MPAISRLLLLVIPLIFAWPHGSAAAYAGSPHTQPGNEAIDWQPWSDGAFARARKEHKFVLMDLQAVWCHWCHVMDQVTYSEPDVIRLVREKYIAVKVDQDSRPDISNRYEDYGWPATVVFNADGGEIVKRQGYIPPKPMARMLQAIIDDPTPGPSVTREKPVTFSRESLLAPALQQELESRLNAAYDVKLGGWGTVHKFIDWDALEYTMLRARRGDADAAARARQTLNAGLKLIDPVWGGVYQYSVEGDWDHPHYEKLMQFQAEVMRVYALAFANFHDPAYQQASQDVHRYINMFLRSPAGAYYVSQDADLHEGEYADKYFALGDSGRRKQGVPRVDQHLYARENGWAIRGLIDLYEWTGDATALVDAERAAHWALDHESIGQSDFRHGGASAGGPYLADNLAMARAFLMLYEATAEQSWLEKSEATANFIAANFGAVDAAGFPTAAQSNESGYQPRPQVDENVAAARFFNLLFHYTGKAGYRALAKRAMRFVATPRVVEDRGFFVASILLADAEVNDEPLHVTVLGRKADPQARELFTVALRAPTGYKRIEWWDAAEGALSNSDVQYPRVKSAAAFVCTNGGCSTPIASAQGLDARLAAKIGK